LTTVANKEWYMSWINMSAEVDRILVQLLLTIKSLNIRLNME